MANLNIDISVNQRQAQQKIERLKNSVRQTEKGFDKLSLSIKQSSGALGSFVGNVAAIGFTKLIASTAAFAANAVKVTGEVETLRTQFEVLTGSVGAANKAVTDLQKFAASTPFQFKDLAKSQQRLLSFGFTLEEVQDRMTDIGDVAAASGADIGELSLIFGQVRAAGKLTGERLLQLQERAIPIGPALAKSMGVAESSIRDLVSKGKVDFATFEKAFQSLNDEGQFAFEGMIKRSRTLEGRISTLKDNFELLTANIGGRLAPAFKAIVTTVTLFIQKLQNSNQFQGFLDAIGKQIPNAIAFAVDAFSFIINTVLNAAKIFNLFRSGVTTAFSTILKVVRGFVEGFSKLLGALGIDVSGVSKAITNVQTDIINSLDMTASGFAEQAADIDASQKKINDAVKSGKEFILKTYQEELKETKAITQEQIDDEKRLAEAKRLRLEQEAAARKEKIDGEKKLAEELRVLKEEQKIQDESDRLFQMETEQIFNDSRLVALQDFFTRQQEAEIQAGINAATSEAERQKLILKAQIEGQKKRRSSQKNACKAEENLDRQCMESKIRAFGGMFGALASLAQQGGARQFKIMKALAKAQVITNGIAAVSEAARQPYPINIPLTIKAVAEGAARLSAINSQQPRFENGGIVPGSSFSGDQVQARVNSGEMILNRQQQSQLFNLANGAGAGGQEIIVNTTVELDGEVVGNSVSRQVANGLVLGEVQ